MGKQSNVPSLTRSGRGDGSLDAGGTSAPGLLSGHTNPEGERNVVMTSKQKNKSPLRQNETLHHLTRNHNQGDQIRQVYKVEGVSGDIAAGADID